MSTRFLSFHENSKNQSVGAKVLIGAASDLEFSRGGGRIFKKISDIFSIFF